MGARPQQAESATAALTAKEQPKQQSEQGIPGLPADVPPFGGPTRVVAAART